MKLAPLFLATIVVYTSHQANAAALRVSVQSGEFNRQGSIASFTVPAAARGWQRLETESGGAVPFQVDAEGKGWFVLDELNLKTAVEDALRLRGGFEPRRWV